MLTDSDTTTHGYFGVNIKAGSHVLGVGDSTGVFAAMLCHRTGKDGVTISLHSVSQTGLTRPCTRVESCLSRVMRSQVRRALCLGFAPCAPYDVIQVTKVVEEIPPLLLTQHASPGHMVIPVRTDGRCYDSG